MRYVLKAEDIGRGIAGTPDDPRRIMPGVFRPPRLWVARLDSRGNRTFVNGQRDYKDSNGRGSRGIFVYWFLEDGVYEVRRPVAWKKDEQFVCIVENGKMEQVEWKTAKDWLTARGL